MGMGAKFWLVTVAPPTFAFVNGCLFVCLCFCVFLSSLFTNYSHTSASLFIRLFVFFLFLRVFNSYFCDFFVINTLILSFVFMLCRLKWTEKKLSYNMLLPSVLLLFSLSFSFSLTFPFHLLSLYLTSFLLFYYTQDSSLLLQSTVHERVVISFVLFLLVYCVTQLYVTGGRRGSRFASVTWFR